MIAAILVAMSLSTAAGSTERYALEVSIMRDGVETVSTRSLIQEDGASEISVSDGLETFQMNAELSVVQGDGDDAQLALAVSITNNSDEPLQPQMIVRRGGTARMEVGTSTDHIKLSLSPIAD